MNRLLIPFGLAIVFGCATQKAGKTTGTGPGDTRIKTVELLDDNTYLLSEPADDKSYGYQESNPVKVGGINESGGPINEERFLNALLGPNGEAIEYVRTGSCCPFKTPNGLIDNTGLLDRYEIKWPGAPGTLFLYLNMYDKGDLKIPVGLTAKKR